MQVVGTYGERRHRASHLTSIFLPQEILSFFFRSHPPKEKYLQFSKNILTHHKSYHEIFLLSHVLFFIATNFISDFNDDYDFAVGSSVAI